MRILLKVARIFGICPWQTPSYFGRFYQIFMLCATFSISIVCIYMNGKAYYSNITKMRAFIDLLAVIFTTIQGSVIQITFIVHATSWRNILEEMNIEKEKYSIKTCIVLFIINFFFIARFAWDTFILFTVVGWKSCVYNMYRAFYQYCGMFSVIMMVYINRAMKKQSRSSYKILFNSTISYNRRNFERNYRKLLLLLNNFNNVFGYQILFIMAYSIALLLQSLCNSLKFLEADFNRKVLVLSGSIGNTASTLVLIL